MNQWKRWLKGIYDTEGIPPQLLVTGSAQLNTFKKVGDSLAGRHFQFGLHPFDLKELMQFKQGEKNALFEQLWYCSGFPEPFLKGTVTYSGFRISSLSLFRATSCQDGSGRVQGLYTPWSGK